jgi:hypothetical protein
MTTLRLSFKDGPDLSIALREDMTPTVEGLLSSAPFKARVNRWGDEVYFDAPVSAEIEKDARALMEVGEVAFWPDGSALAIFFGPTPVSTDDRPRAYSPCNIVGRVVGDVAVLRSVGTGTFVKVTRVE